MYEIEKGIPAPTTAARDVYKFSKMEIGDSFVVPLAELSKVRSAAGQYKIRNPEFNYATRKDVDGVRLWRIEK